MKKKRIYLSSPHMGSKEESFIKEAFKSNWIAPLGPNVTEFEREIANKVNVKGATALTSGTAALHMAIKYLNVKKGDRVFCSSLTFAASCNPIIYEGGIPVFIDSTYESYNMCPIALQKAFEEHKKKGILPKAVIVVHLYGQSANMDKILNICNKYNTPIIEDAAESLGATYKGQQTGTFGEFGLYSFNGNKIITTSGGGVIISNNEEALNKIRFWSTQSRENERHYEHKELGYNYRMSNVLAGIGRGQLQVLRERINKKKEIFQCYKRAFSNISDIEMMPICDYGEPNYWLSVCTINKNSKVKPLDIILALELENIECRPVWKPMHLQPFYKSFEFYSKNERKNSISEDIFNRGLCLPSDTKMDGKDLDNIIEIIKRLFL
ncbi:DegT/DnrJ/EryC1/StrS family aminotransferase [Clostridium tarantellae]|uniref:Aminotransferase DegT n=1 Tax=Clostridium tarantellae TaxID=39493 RepID=A0A6I1MLG0_9CLOT|nr:DegT/DnrJ/EryC1/StrS family aminotransferase [Clostridium tarantellae]MPQ43062.1 aminotransferase DegT [Clostridium tarantellae]